MPSWAGRAKRLDVANSNRKYTTIQAAIRPSIPRAKPLSLDTIKILPKAELHQHLDGSVRTSTILDLAYEQVCNAFIFGSDFQFTYFFLGRKTSFT